MVHKTNPTIKANPTLPVSDRRNSFGIHKTHAPRDWLEEIDEEMKIKEQELKSVEEEMDKRDIELEKEELEREKRLLLQEQKEELEREKEKLEIEREHLMELEEEFAEKLKERKPEYPPEPQIVEVEKPIVIEKEVKPKEPVLPKIEMGLKKVGEELGKVGKMAVTIPKKIFPEKKKEKEKEKPAVKENSGTLTVSQALFPSGEEN